jgi:hypothetical protein
VAKIDRWVDSRAGGRRGGGAARIHGRQVCWGGGRRERGKRRIRRYEAPALVYDSSSPHEILVAGVSPTTQLFRFARPRTIQRGWKYIRPDGTRAVDQRRSISSASERLLHLLRGPLLPTAEQATAILAINRTERSHYPGSAALRVLRLFTPISLHNTNVGSSSPLSLSLSYSFHK